MILSLYRQCINCESFMCTVWCQYRRIQQTKTTTNVRESSRSIKNTDERREKVTKDALGKQVQTRMIPIFHRRVSLKLTENEYISSSNKKVFRSQFSNWRLNWSSSIKMVVWWPVQCEVSVSATRQLLEAFGNADYLPNDDWQSFHVIHKKSYGMS